jgi:predicted alpha/beta-fold hydrolase
MYGKLFREIPPAPVTVERWPTPDGDHLTVHRLAGDPEAPMLVILHGLEGGPHSQYAQGLLHEARRRGWWATLVVWRTCDRQHPVNAVRRAYHSGETTDTTFVIARLTTEAPHRPIGLVGISLGGNVLCKWMGEHGDALPPQVRGGVAVSVPYDLARASAHIDQGFSRVYSKFFLKTLIAKTEAKLERFPDLVDRAALTRIRTLWDFDDVVTGPIHGFTDARDYYTRSSALHFLAGVRRPLLLLNAENDPFLPRAVLDDVREVARATPALHVEFPRHGGHVGFIGGPHPRSAFYWMESRALDWLEPHVRTSASGVSS